MSHIVSLLTLTLVLMALPQVKSGAGESVPDYNRDVKPILSDKCYRCHGPDSVERATDLRLDDLRSVFSVLESGVQAIVPHDLDSSEVISRVTSDDVDLRMPPRETGKQLTQDEITILQAWVAAGAKWGAHWSFVRPERPRIPSVGNSSWPRNAIDCFVLDRLNKKGWQPAPAADDRTLSRRATFAATGFPPTPIELKHFLKDSSSHAYQRLVDRLLQSPRYGEHQARYWLDLARYGDTHGLHLDNERSIWRYRDWVIDAFNANMPYDQFTIEQLAGDLLPDATLAQRIATGFNRCNVTTSEGGAIKEEFLARYAVDRVETTSAVWLGLTTGCAACHDHKFDPISHKEFYQLYAYFDNLTEKAMDGNAKLPPPAVKAPTFLQLIEREEILAKQAQVNKQVSAIRKELRTNRDWETSFARTFASAVPAPSDPLLHLSMDEVSSFKQDAVVGNLSTVPGRVNQAWLFDGMSHVRFADVGDFEHSDAFSLGAWIQLDGGGASTVLSRMDDTSQFRGYDLYVSSGKIYVHIIHEWPGNAIRVNSGLPIRQEKWHHVMATYDGTGKAAGVKVYVDGIAQDLEYTHDSLQGSIKTEEPFRIGQRKQAAGFRGAIDELVVFERSLVEDEILALMGNNPLVTYMAMKPAKRTRQQDNQLLDAYMQSKPHLRELFNKRELVEKRLARLEQAIPSTLVMEERPERRETYALVRGEYHNQGEQVWPNVPQVLPKSKSQEQTRLALARWLVDAEHPLTARVTVNRIWQQYFGVGLVKTSEDFGAQGEWPSHPKLLDYLATELIESGWDLKSIHRKILLSATFQQSSRMTKAAVLEDPENRMLARGPRFRLDAESIRDFAMATSGLLVGQIGGPSVKPSQPLGLWNAVGYTSSNTANFEADQQDKQYRRGFYTFWKRTSPPPQMQILDAPSREVCTTRRPRTNTPAAALLLMNDVQFVEAAKNLADRVLQGNKNDDARIDSLYEICLSRRPSASERKIIRSTLSSNLSAYRESSASAEALLTVGESEPRWVDKPELAAWTLLCSMVLNLDEAINQH